MFVNSLFKAVTLIVQIYTAPRHANNELFALAAFKRRFECVSGVVRAGYLLPLGCVFVSSPGQGGLIV